jgi:diguanylate cyclase (GGDEF)-like protein/PAS domain S-box-containing protein
MGPACVVSEIPADRCGGAWLPPELDDSAAAVLVLSPSGRVLQVNAAATQLLGYSLAELQHDSLARLLAGPHAEAQHLQRAAACLRALAAPQARPLQNELLVRTRSGRALWVCAVVGRAAGGAARPARAGHTVVVLTDITRTKVHEQLQHRVLEAIVQDVPMPEVMALLCREIESIAPEVVCSVLAVDAERRLRPLAAPGMPAEVAEAIDGLPIGPVVGSCGTAAWRGEPVMVLDIATDPLWADFKALVLPLGLASCWSTPICSGGVVVGTFAFYFREQQAPSAFHHHLVDVSSHLCALLLEREKTRDHLHRLANFDPLTALPNRAMLLARLQRVLHAAQQGGWPMALLVIDLHRFKRAVETHGQAVADGLLIETVQRLKAEVRETDLVARLADDGFAIVLPQCMAPQAAALAERVLAAIERPLAVGGITLQLGAAIGVAMHPGDGSDAATLLRHAERAMHQAKGQSRAAVRFFSSELNDAARERAMLESDLRHALRHGGLALHYQPQVAGDDVRRLHGTEALLRWQHPVLGAVPPLRVVALAEDCGLMGELGHWVLEAACRQLGDWRRRGVPVPRVAINLSPTSFQQPGLAQRVAQRLLHHGLQPADLTLELTESVMLDPDPAVLATIDALHAQGVRLSMDDFGTGYSSLGHLLRLPVSELKLDRSFVQGLHDNPTAQALTHSVLRIAQSLHMEVVAEGVETPGQHRFLAERHCTMLQGYLFARPLAAADLESWLAGLRAP